MCKKGASTKASHKGIPSQKPSRQSFYISSATDFVYYDMGFTRFQTMPPALFNVEQMDPTSFSCRPHS